MDADKTTTANPNAAVKSTGAQPMRVDVGSVLRQKLGRKSRYLPHFAVRILERIICQDRLNEILAHHGHLRGADFCKAALRELNITVQVTGLDRLPPRTHRRVMFACNHPLGGPDGLALIQFMHDYYGGEVFVVVNDILMAVDPLKDAFVPVNKHGAQRHEGARIFDSVLDSDNPVLFFPAGLVSRKRKGVIADLPWKRTFVNKAILSHRDIIPLYFSGTNSRTFYRLARLRERLGIKFNIEMIRLPRELVRLTDKTLTINCGEMIPWTELRGGKDVEKTVSRIREAVYAMAPHTQNKKNI